MDVDGAVPALEELLGQAAWVRRLARSLTLDDARAEDAAQDAFVAALERPPKSTRNLRGWFARVLANAARRAGRAESRRARRERASAHPEGLPSAAELASELEWQRRIAAAVLALDEPYRTALLLHFYRGLAPAEIARRLGEPAATVRSHLKRGLDQLRARFDREHDGERRAWSVVLAAWTREEPEAALAAASGLAVAAWIGVTLLAGGGSWLAWRASRSSARAATEPLAAIPVAPPPSRPEALSPAEPPAGEPAQSARVASSPLPKSTTAAVGPLFIGFVQDPDGAPIVGARLAIYPNKSWPRPEPVGRGVTGPDGRFAFPIGPTDSNYLMIGAEAEGFQGLTMDPVIADREISIELTWHVELFGVVRDAESGASLAGVELSGGEDGSTVSDEHGSFRLGGFPSGLQRSIRARLDGYAATEQEVLVRGKEPQALDLELTPGTSIEVEVFEREMGRPLAGAGVHDPWRKDGWTSTAANGRFTTWIAREHPLELDVTLEGYWPLTWQWTPGEADLGATPRLPMAREIFIRGRIADEHGARVEGDWLYPEYQEPHIDAHQELPPETLRDMGTPGHVQYGAREPGSGAESEADGRYRLRILGSEFPFTLKAGARGYVTSERGPLVFSSSSQGSVIDFVLERAATIHGRTLHGGKPWSGRVVFRSPVGASPGGAWADGDYSINDVPAGTWTFAFQDEDRAEHLPVTLTVEAGRDYEHDFIEGEERPLGSISGRVLGAAGRQPENAYVTARPSDDVRGEEETADVAADGSFVCRVPVGRSYSVAAWRWTRTDSVWGAKRVVTPDAEGVELDLPEVGLLRLRLIDAATASAVQPRSRSLSNAVHWWRLDEDSNGEEDAEIDTQGGIELEVATGTYQVVVDLGEEGYLPSARRAVSVTNDRNPVPQVLELVRGVPVDLIFTGEGAASPLHDHLVFLVERAQLASIDGPFPAQGPPSNHRINGICMRIDDPALMNQFLTGDFYETGRARHPGLAPGHYFVQCYPDDFVFEPAELELAGPEKVQLQIRWRAK